MTGSDAIRRWRESPPLFVRECLGAIPDPWQDEVLEKFNTEKRIALCASKGPGKSTLLAWVCWLFLLTRPHPKIPCTSISGDNLRDGLWTELAKWQARSEILKTQFTWTAERVAANDHPQDWYASARQWSKSADATRQAETLAGMHGEHVLAIVDEAGGVPRSVMAAADAVLATGGDTHLLIAGNTTDIDSALGDVVTKERDLWFVMEINGDPDNPKRAPRVDINWAREQILKYGRDDPFVLVNVFGRFPPRSSSKLIGPGDVDEAVKRTMTRPEWMNEAKVLGVDVAREGDDETVIIMRQGRATFMPNALHSQDTMEIVGLVALEHNRVGSDAICVDACGVGAGVADRLIQLGYPCYAIDSADRPIRPEPKLFNRRAECWWAMAHWLKRGGGCLPNDPVLRKELIGPQMAFDGHNRLKLETKAEMKRRGIGSPNRADALSYTFAIPVVSKQDSMFSRPGRVVSEYDPYAEAQAMATPYAVPQQAGRMVTEYDPYAEGR